MLVVIGLLGCASPKVKTPTTPPAEGLAIDQLRLLSVPVALNLDQQPGLDGFCVKVFGVSRSHPKPVPIREGVVEIMMFDGLLPKGTNAPQPLCTWKYAAEELPQYELKGAVGTGYQLSPLWGEKRPARNRITVFARYLSPAGFTLGSAPSVISIPSQ